MIRIAICDDEKHMSDHIRSIVSDFFRKKNREISFRMFFSGEELLNYDGQIDILFLNIQMKDMDDMAETMSYPCSLRDIDICIYRRNSGYISVSI